MNKYHNNKIFGFTLIELLVVIGIVSALSAVAVPSYSLMKNHAALNSDTQELFSAIRYAQNQAMSGQDGVAWGVRLEANRYIVYGGDWSAPHNTQTHILDNGIQIIQSVNSEIVFNRLNGTSTNKTITIGFIGGNQKTIQINNFGKISQL